MVVKNTILQKAINKLAANKDKAYLRDLQKQTKNIRENTAILSFGQDWGAGMNAFFKFAKETKQSDSRSACSIRPLTENRTL
jgi:ribosomal protein L10